MSACFDGAWSGGAKRQTTWFEYAWMGVIMEKARGGTDLEPVFEGSEERREKNFKRWKGKRG